jgi:cardiolipin synthase
MLAAIEGARESIRLEMYIFSASPLGDSFRDALVKAAKRGVRVNVLNDSIGSVALPGNYWKPLEEAGGAARRFNPLALSRFGIRDHRKLLVCDEAVAFIGGFNIAPEYEGDGITRGWFDFGLSVTGHLAEELAAAADEMFERADFHHKHFMVLRKSDAKKTIYSRNEQLLLSGPGRGRSPIKRALRRDLAHARDVQIIMAYFLPTWRIRRSLARVVRTGGRVELMLAGKSDVAVSQLAGQSLYRRFLAAGMNIHEYEPQILHAKLIIIDNVVYVGSANLDQRSLNINYELMIRFDSQELAAKAREFFVERRRHARTITLEQWRGSRNFWRRLKQRWAYFLLVRIDPYIARRQWRALPD